ncbi:MAG: hypothetical protein IKB16_08690 [Lentisphaeria bacterium]|nr:hypothetical protein [Lentisphaeria bacterium]
MKKKTALFPVLFLTVQSLAIAILLFASWQFFHLSGKMVKQDNISMLLELTKNYEKSIHDVNHNFQQSQDVIPSVRKALTEIKEVIDKIGQINFFGKKVKKRSSAFKNSQKAINDSITALNKYEQKTQPSILKSLQETEKALQKLNHELNKNQRDFQDIPTYVWSMLLAFIILMMFNTIFIMYLYKQQKTA